MKKSISLLLVMVLILWIFANIDIEKEDSTDDAILSVAVVVSSEFGDKSFNDSAQQGTEKLFADFGVNVSYTECKNEGFKQKMMDAAKASNVVVAVGWKCYEIAEVAPEYPDVKFIFIDNVAEGVENIPNLLCITYAQNEGAFLAGYIAAEMSQTGIIGAIGGEDSVAVNDFFAGYRQGAEYADPDITVETVYAGTYTDPAVGKDCALQLADKGADVIFNVAGNTGAGIFEAAKERGFLAVGVDADQKLTLPEYDDVIICSVKKEIGKSIYDTVKDYMEEDSWNGGRVLVNDMASGHVSIAYGDEASVQQISDSLKAEVEELAAMIVAGEIEVETVR